MSGGTAGAAEGRTAGSGALAWRGGFGRLWSAAAVSRFGDALVSSLRTAPPPGRSAIAGRTLRGEIADGMRALRRAKVLRAFCPAVGLGTIGRGALIATLVVAVKGWLGAGLRVRRRHHRVRHRDVRGGLLADRTVAMIGGTARTLLAAGAVASAYGPRTPALLAAALLGLGAVALIPVLQTPDSASSDGGQIPHTAC